MRRSGILLPVFSLPSRYGIGDFGPEAYRFVDFLSEAGQSLWQILPLNPTNYGDSPYQSFSTFAGNPYFISPERLIEEGLLTKQEADGYDFGSDPEKIDYGKLYSHRLAMLELSYRRFQGGDEYSRFVQDNAWWLDDYALFMAFKNAHHDVSWLQWEDDLRFRRPQAMACAREQYADRIGFYKFLQYEFSRQWTALKAYANQKGIQIVGDIPIYVAFDSADVWAHTEEFQLDENLLPIDVAGCPPDAFSEDGQLWGNPLYRWEQMAAEPDPFHWWKQRISCALKWYDIVRIDHFRGFAGYYTIPYGSRNARHGVWKKGPRRKFFQEIEKSLGSHLPIIAEDLGYLTPDVYRLKEQTGFPGMKVLQFAFDNLDNEYLPHRYTSHCVVYTGTHDNDTILGWAAHTSAWALEHAQQYCNLHQNEGLNWAMMRLALESCADTCILTMQDLLGLDSQGRINTPATVGGNWQWRMKGECLNSWLAKIIKDLTILYARLPEDRNREPEVSEESSIAEETQAEAETEPEMEEIPYPDDDEEEKADS